MKCRLAVKLRMSILTLLSSPESRCISLRRARKILLKDVLTLFLQTHTAARNVTALLQCRF